MNSEQTVTTAPEVPSARPLRPAYQVLASAIDARLRCERTGNTEWFDRWTEQIEQISRDVLPSGSGIDSGCTVDLEKSTGEKIVINTSFHHMAESGMYDGWTEHTVTIRASLFLGLQIAISGRDRNEIKEYLTYEFDHCLNTEI